MNTASIATRKPSAAVVLVGLLALSLNLRAALAGYPPLLTAVRDELGVGAGTAGLVQAGAVLMMAAGSFAGPRFAARFGAERGLAVAVGLVAAGSLVRGVPVLVLLIAGSVVIGFGIGVAGVLLTAVIKDRLSTRVGAVTGGYVVAMMLGSTAASALAVPIAVAVGGWSFSLAVWAVPAIVAAAAWTGMVPARTRQDGAETPSPAPARAHRLPWHDGFARLAACYQIGTSMLVYGWLTWLAPYYESQGVEPAQAGLLLAAWSISHIPGALFVPAVADRGRWTFWAGLMLASVTVGTLGVLLLPQPPVVGPWLWVVLMGIGSGAGFPLGLTMITRRTPDSAASASTSALAMGGGYTVAGTGPLLMGVLIDAAGGGPLGYHLAIGLLLAAAVLQGVAIARIGDG
ncbi:MFS transporter [Pseudonocardia sp. TRM90224]|uniref:MFS transporter n=1 Tax=Pseudonocardia sp. TRM90224 TaxID=2812678 RepID=UPI001E56EC5A|nr:MFS transporter [Pseudonocardia sp. TRM90224]